MRVIYAKPNQLVVLTGRYEPTQIRTFVLMLMWAPEGYIDMYPVDVGSFSLMEEKPMVIPFMHVFFKRARAVVTTNSEVANASYR